MRDKGNNKATNVLRPEYHFDYFEAARGKYCRRLLEEDSKVIILEPDITRVFQDSASLNGALRSLLEPTRSTKRTKGTQQDHPESEIPVARHEPLETTGKKWDIRAMNQPEYPPNLRGRTREAVAHYRQTRTAQRKKQEETGKADQGLRGAVTGGAQMDGFIDLFTELITRAGIPPGTCIPEKNRSTSRLLPAHKRMGPSRNSQPDAGCGH